MAESRRLSLSRQAVAVLEHLVASLSNVRPGDPSTYKTYGEIHSALGLPGSAQDLEYQGLAELANAIFAANLPAVTGLVIRKDTGMPGEGYFKVYGRPAMDFDWWRSEVARSKSFDWRPYLPARERSATSPPLPKTPVAADATKTTRVETTVYRVLRDTLVARRVKQLHGYRCQICGEGIELADGTRYVEAHHVRPLGEPHNGPDTEQNVVCVCPNHHAELDYFARPIESATLRIARGHFVDQLFIDYHNSWHRKIARR
ncbi:HNH endonuclease [Ensifer adhaerens]